MATEMATVESPVIRAAGGIIQRVTSRGEEVLTGYRKRHQDWAPLPTDQQRRLIVQLEQKRLLSS
jgi:hypothetical protein